MQLCYAVALVYMRKSQEDYFVLKCIYFQFYSTLNEVIGCFLIPFASATSFKGTNELRVVLAPTLSTSEELKALLLFIYIYIIHGTTTLPLKIKNWNTTSFICVVLCSKNYLIKIDKIILKIYPLPDRKVAN